MRDYSDEKSEIRALVIRVRMYLANEWANCRTSYERYEWCGLVLNLSGDRVRRIIDDKRFRRIKHMGKEEAIRELRRRNSYMYTVAMSDITESKYESLIKTLTR